MTDVHRQALDAVATGLQTDVADLPVEFVISLWASLPSFPKIRQIGPYQSFNAGPYLMTAFPVLTPVERASFGLPLPDWSDNLHHCFGMRLPDE